MKIHKISQVNIPPSEAKTWPTTYAPSGGFPKMTRKTQFPVDIRMSVGEFLLLDDFLDNGGHDRIVREIIIRIIRTHPELIRAKTEGRI